MRRLVTSSIAALALGAGLLTAPPAAAAPPDSDSGRLEVFTGQISADQLQRLRALGLDQEDISVGKAGGGKVAVEVVMPSGQGTALRAKGFDLQVKKVDGQKASQRSRALTAQTSVFRPYGGDDGIRADIVAAAKAHPDIAETVDIGTSLKGTPITAVRVTKGARKLGGKKSKRPAVLFQGTQHAREWITPENVRRQLHHFLSGYGSNAELTKIIDTTDVWFIPVINVDGYDLTFTPEYRMWRKNLRDNDGDGEVSAADGVDINRNFPYKWGYDNEGSSPSVESATYRGRAPGSEPETKAQDRLVAQIKPKYMVNYHSAAELLLYGVGWQTQTPSPDDHIFEALLGDDAEPAVPGYDPDLGAELYTTNGETDGHMSEKYGTLTITPEMATCQTVSAADPDDQWDPADCPSVFHFPDDERLIQQEFTKNLPLAIAIAKSAHDPDHPVSVVDRTVPDLAADEFSVSHGTTQQVAVEARRSLKGLKLRYRIDGGRTRSGGVREWRGGERYGAEGRHYFGEYRGTVRGAGRGDKVEVWFEARKKGAKVATKPFTYTVADDVGGDVLVLAAEDVTGASPDQGVTRAKYADTYAGALKKAGYSSDVYDVDANGRRAPHHLGVLGHYKAVVWETGDDIITRAPGQPGGTAAKVAVELELSVRDYLNEGGKLLFTGKYAGAAQGANGSYFYEPDAPGQPECAVRSDPPCLPILDDFLQYYLGAYTYVDGGGQDAAGRPYPVKGDEGRFAGWQSTLNGGDSADNQDHTASFLTTSSFLPEKEFPQFASSAPIGWQRPGGSPYDPRTGDRYAFSGASDVAYKRLTRTVDLTGKSSGDLSFHTSYDIEANWDHMIVEARTAGGDDWTTLPDANGHTTTAAGDSCEAGWRTLHPFLDHYQGADCSSTGTTGAWHSATGKSNGWQEWKIDLSKYAGKQVEVSITYVTDWATGGLGVFVDDTVVTADGATVTQTSFEDDLGGWTVGDPPAGSPPSADNWSSTETAFQEGAGVATRDTVYLGFGAEGITTAAARTEFVRRAMRHLLR